VGSFTIDEAAGPDDCALLPVAAAVRSLATVTIGDDVAALVANGRVLEAWPGDGPWAVFDQHGTLLAVYEPYREHEAKPCVVLPVTADG
jgi:tRNA pseudouridine55 synthase